MERCFLFLRLVLVRPRFDPLRDNSSPVSRRLVIKSLYPAHSVNLSATLRSLDHNSIYYYMFMLTRSVPSKRILSLRDPSQKMSKSAPNPSSRITLTDSPKDILAKLKSAVTDSQREITYDPVERPGVANLLTIWSACDTPGSDGRTRTPSELAAEAREWGLGKLKATVGDVVVERLKGLREEYERLKGDEGYLREVAEKGRAKAAERAAKTMEEVRKVVGLSDI